MSNNTIPPVPGAIIPAPPVHPLSALVTIVIDLLWSGPEVGATLSLVAIPALPLMITGCGFMCFVSVLLIQRYVADDLWGASIAKGLAMGIIAGVPYPVTGTVAGAALLGWAGLHRIEEARKLIE